MTNERIAIEIVLDDGSIIKGFQKIEQGANLAGEKIGNTFEKNISDGVTNAVSIATKRIFILAAAIGSALALGKGIKDAIASENAVNRLNTVLALTGKFSKETSDSVQSFAESLSNASKFSGELILGSASTIQALAKLDEQGLKRATLSAANLASVMNVDIRAASQAIGKALNGNISALNRYGVSVKKGATDTETMANVLASLEDKFSGGAKSATNTFSGALQQLGNRFSDFNKLTGEAIIKSPALISIIKFITEEINNLTNKLKGFGIAELFNNIIKSISEFAANFGALFITPFEFAINAVKLVFSGLTTFLQGSFTGMLEILTGGIEKLSDLPLIGNKIKENILPSLISTRDIMKETFDTMSNDTKTSFDNIFNFETSDKIDTFFNRMNDKVQSSVAPLDTLKNKMEEVGETVEAVSFDIGKAFGQLAAQGISKGIQLMATNLAEGKSLFANFDKFLIQTLGEMAITVGTMIIGTALALTSLVNLSLLQALVLGGALVAIGAVMVAKSGGSGATQPSVSGSSGGGLASSPSNDFTNTEQQERDPQASVVVNIQGSIFSTKETADNIVGLINDSFEQRGVRVFA